jgi:hypothetical protein
MIEAQMGKFIRTRIVFFSNPSYLEGGGRRISPDKKKKKLMRPFFTKYNGSHL